jgi:hypothetical protein
VYNVVDEPAPVREWLPALAADIGAKRPRRIPRWLARLVQARPVSCDDQDPGRLEREGEA